MNSKVTRDNAKGTETGKAESSKRIALQKSQYEERNRDMRNKRRRETYANDPKPYVERVQNALKRKRSERETLILGSLTNVEHIDTLDIGDLVEICFHCNGLTFKNETGRSKNSCCHGGKIKANILNEYPTELRQMIFGVNEESRHFRDNIRRYNNAFAFASFNCTNVDIQQKGPYCMRIKGEANMQVTTSLLGKGIPRYAQIYIYDDDETSKFRMNNSLRETVVIKLQRIMANNPYALKYRQLNEVYKQTEVPTVTLNFLTFKGDDMRRYNEPLVNSIAAIITTNDGAIPENVDVKVFPKKDTECDFLSTTSQHSDPMLFPLIFPNGEHGWSHLMKTPNMKNISPLQFYSYRLTVRCNDSSPIFICGRLTQQYIINCYLTVESQRLKYLRFNQSNLRTECYQGIVDHIIRSDANTADISKLGNIYILPSTFQGSARQMQQLYQDAMAICRKIGRPDLFITMTCNPKWPEITRYLKTLPPGLTANDIPHFTSRLFYQKVSNLIKDLDSVFGTIKAYVYTIEFQKRGLPHVHLLVTLGQKLLNADDIDKFISAEIPNKEDNPLLWQKVMKHMLHGPHINGLPCFDSKKNLCSKNFPKPFITETDMTGSGFPKYKRRNNMQDRNTYPGRKETNVDNSMVVPYNPYLLMKYDCHINVEYCQSIMSIKYIHKYIHKGHDKAKIRVGADNDCSVTDEIQNFVDSRYLSAQESAWRLFELPMHGRSHSVERLPIHLPGMNRIIFQEGNEAHALAHQCHTKLTAYFELNKCDPEARSIKYEDIPLSYRWNNEKKIWQKRKRQISLVSRLVSVSSKAVELFHMKLLLRRIAGAQNFDDLKIVSNNTNATFKDAAIALGLVSCHTEMEDVLAEASSILMPQQLRHFFVYMLMGCANINGSDLWNKFKKHLSEDTSEDIALNQIANMLESENSTLESFGILKPNISHNPPSLCDGIFQEHQNSFEKLYSSLNNDQRNVFDSISAALDKNCCSNCFYIDGPGGVGKTYLYRCLMHYMNVKGKKVFTIAWTGIAAILLPSGRTAHKSFQLPLNIQESTTLYWNSKTKQIIQDTDVFIWDEASMIPAAALESIDIALRDICSKDKPFGGKLFLLGGDFRQILPVLKRAGKTQIINATIKHSSLWQNFISYSLSINMRAGPTQNRFAEWLLEIGNGNVESLLVTDELYSTDIVEEMYLNCDSSYPNQAILTPRNDDVAFLNKRILGQLKGDEIICEGIDRVLSRGTDMSDEGAELMYPIEYINSLMPSGFPPQKLVLKNDAIVMLIRNLCVSDGLCNGTRLLVKGVKKNVLCCEILTGDKKGSIVYIPRIKLDSILCNSKADVGKVN
ncbi:uncharacterized protein B4U80_03589 [Leptotrombidium deliense]|uniref:ATP-dependent DNA helicase n=1 Tax=Leptotrombidium deliense TaxID=299467 RepID=A0A443SK24_9ACAR|nr:uncharacterized protein B4U80_03589 [Leptotrombidium deliense]